MLWYGRTHTHTYILIGVQGNASRVVSSGLSTVESIALDWINQKMYWVDSVTDVIEVANYDGTMRAPLIYTNMSNPRSLCVDPFFGYSSPDSMPSNSSLHSLQYSTLAHHSTTRTITHCQITRVRAVVYEICNGNAGTCSGLTGTTWRRESSARRWRAGSGGRYSVCASCSTAGGPTESRAITRCGACFGSTAATRSTR